MFEWLGENWWALWLTVFLAFAVVEMLTLDLFFIMLGGGALAGMLADFAGADFWLQIVVFCVVSLLMVVFVRPSTYAAGQSFPIYAFRHGLLGYSLGATWFAAELPVGPVTFCMQASNTSVLRAKLAPGRTYYVEIEASSALFGTGRRGRQPR